MKKQLDEGTHFEREMQTSHYREKLLSRFQGHRVVGFLPAFDAERKAQFFILDNVCMCVQ